MATAAQILANQKNAQSSTGPRTPEGKGHSSANSTTHGLAGSFRVLAHENQQEFDQLLADYRSAFPAAGIHEQFLVEEMAQARWRIARIRRLEAEVVRAIAGDNASNPDRALAEALIGNTADAFRTLQRYAAAAERSYYRAHRQLTESRGREIDRVIDKLMAQPAAWADVARSLRHTSAIERDLAAHATAANRSQSPTPQTAPATAAATQPAIPASPGRVLTNTR